MEAGRARSRGPQAKHWCITINNPPRQKRIILLLTPHVEYACGQLEKGEQGVYRFPLAPDLALSPEL